MNNNKGKRILVLLFMLFAAASVFSQEGLVVKEYWGLLYYEIYIELTYNINECVYVSDELVSGQSFYNTESRELKIAYYPRGNTILSANESTKWPPVLRRVAPGELLVVRMNLRKALNDIASRVTDFSVADINQINLIIVDKAWLLDETSNQVYLMPKDMNTQIRLQSKEIVLRTDLSGVWEMIEPTAQSD